VVPWSSSATEEEDKQRDETEVYPRIRAFFAASEERQAFLERKIREQLELWEAEKEYFGYKMPRELYTRLC
jgi:hypothetical protein